MTAAERAILQEMVDDLYEQFVAVVSEGRKMDPAKARKLADGRIYTGRQARALGLVDEMGSLEEAVNAAAKMSGITGKPLLREYGHEGLWDMIFGSTSQALTQTLLERLLRVDLSGARVLSPTQAPQFR